MSWRNKRKTGIALLLVGVAFVGVALLFSLVLPRALQKRIADEMCVSSRVIASGVCFKNVQHPLPWLHVTLIGGRPGTPSYPQVFRRLGGRQGAALVVLFVEDTSTPLPLKRHTLPQKYWCFRMHWHPCARCQSEKQTFFSNMRSDFFSKHPEVIHQTQMTLMGKSTFLHKQFIKIGEKISKSINNSRAPSIRILRGPWTVRINGIGELVLTGPC